jgi:hypothetical protein
LPDQAVVVRGGRMVSRESLRESAEDYFAWTKAQTGEGIYGLSVCSLANQTGDEIAHAVGTARLPQTTMRESTVGTLRGFGYEVLPSGPAGHATLVLPNPPSDDDWDNLEEAFDEPRHNPVARKAKDG